MADLMRPAHYARSRNFSKQYIAKCMDHGLIHRAIVTVSGRRLLAPEVADEEMAENRPDATAGVWHEARGLPRRRPRTQEARIDEDSAKLIDDVLIPFSLDLFDRMANSVAIFLREDCGLPAAQALRHIEVEFLVFWRHLGVAVGRPDLKLDRDGLPDIIQRLGTKKGRAALIAALDARPPHPPAEAGPTRKAELAEATDVARDRRAVHRRIRRAVLPERKLNP